MSDGITHYFSKWRGCWVFFRTTMGFKYKPNDWQIEQMRKMEYKLK